MDGLMIAAGFSSRMGEFKPRLKFGNKTLFDLSIDAMRSCCSTIVVVGGHRIEILEELAENYSFVKLVHNMEFEQGMFSSIRTGIEHITSGLFFYTPCDYPLVDAGTYEKMLDYHRSRNNIDILIPTYEGRKGHPVLINSEHIPRIQNEPDDSNLKAYINRTGFGTVDVDSDTILMDIDTPNDYNRARELLVGPAN